MSSEIYGLMEGDEFVKRGRKEEKRKFTLISIKYWTSFAGMHVRRELG